MEEKPLLKIPFGLRNGELVHISQIVKLGLHGRDCGCICPNCKSPLEARIFKDEQKRSYFAHSGKACSFQQAYETSIHLLAKKIISEKGKLLFPSITEKISDIPQLIEIYDQYNGSLNNYEDSNILEIKPQRYIDLDFVKVEQTVGDVKPDLIVYSGENICFVEIAVTHFIDEVKKEKLIKMNYPVIEIDLSNYISTEVTLETLEHEIIDNPRNRQWIYYPQIDVARERAIKKREQEINNTNDENIKHRREYIEKYRSELKRLHNDDLVQQNIRKLNFYKELSSTTLPFYLDIPISGEVYINCDRRIWQSLIFDKFVYYRNDGEISFNKIKSWLENHNDTIKINWQFENDKKRTARIFYKTIKKYLRYLSFLGFISPIYEVSKKDYFAFEAALWNSRSLNISDKYIERAELICKSIKTMSRENINPDEYIARSIHKVFAVDLDEVTTSNSPHDWIA